MPKRAPAKVAVSPKATRRVSWICPWGSMKMPQKSKISPPIERTEAVISCVFGAMIFKIFCKDIPEKGTFANVLGTCWDLLWGLVRFPRFWASKWHKKKERACLFILFPISYYFFLRSELSHLYLILS